MEDKTEQVVASMFPIYLWVNPELQDLKLFTQKTKNKNKESNMTEVELKKGLLNERRTAQIAIPSLKSPILEKIMLRLPWFLEFDLSRDCYNIFLACLVT